MAEFHQPSIEDVDGEIRIRLRADGTPLRLRPLGSTARVCTRILQEALRLTQGDEPPPIGLHAAGDSILVRISGALEIELLPSGTGLTEGVEMLRVLLTPHAADKPLVLVVEDDLDTRRTLCALLSLWGITAVRAEDGEQALRLAHAFRPAAALIDIGIPRLNGWAMAEHIRRDPDLSPMRLFALSGYGASGDLKRSRDAGFDEHLVKPYRSQQLRELLDSVFPPPALVTA